MSEFTPPPAGIPAVPPYTSGPVPPAAAGYPAAPQNGPYAMAPQGYSPYVVAAPPTEGLAVASMVCGIASFVLLPVLAAIAAIVTGHMALARIKQNGRSGAGMAITGLVLGYFGLAVGLIITISFMTVFMALLGVVSSLPT